MAKSGDLTPKQRARIRDLLNERIEEEPKHKRTRREIAKSFGLDVNTLHKIFGAKSGIGINVLLRLRPVLRKSIDEILGLPPVGLEKAEPPAGVDDAWKERASGARFARIKGVPEYIIDTVQARYEQHTGSKSWTSKRWTTLFIDAWTVERARQAEIREVFEAVDEEEPSLSLYTREVG